MLQKGTLRPNSSVVVVSSLLDMTVRSEFIQEIAEEYEELRLDHVFLIINS